MTGTISWKLAATGKEHYSYDFSLLSGAAGLVYGYTAVIPIGLWATLKWFGSESANLMECWALYGYANLIWIPVSLISWSPLSRKPTASSPLSTTNMYNSAQLHLRRRRLRPLSSLPPPQSISRPLRNRRQNIQDLTDRSRGTPCWSRNRNQDPLLCASKSCEERFGRRCRAATSSRCTSGRKSCRTVFLILEPCNIISARR